MKAGICNAFIPESKGFVADALRKRRDVLNFRRLRDSLKSRQVCSQIRLASSRKTLLREAQCSCLADAKAMVQYCGDVTHCVPDDEQRMP
jgi:hypothetical protein